VRRQAGEAGDLAAVELAEFGEAGDQHGGDDGTDARDGAQAAALLGELGVGGEEGLDLGLDGGEVARQHLEQASDLVRDPALCGLARTVLLAADHGHQVVAAGDQGREPSAVGVKDRGGRELQRPAHGRQHLGIDPVGLGQPAAGTSELAGLARVHPGVRHTGPGQCLRQRPLVAAGGLEDHQRAARSSRKAGQRRAGRGDPFAPSGGEMKDVDPVLGDIDADEVLWQGHGACP